MRKVFTVLGLAIFAYLLVNIIYELPAFGSFQNKDVGEYYIWRGLKETGSANIVNSIIWDFRGYDTLGEETVLFAAAAGVFLILGRKSDGHNNENGE